MPRYMYRIFYKIRSCEKIKEDDIASFSWDFHKIRPLISYLRSFFLSSRAFTLYNFCILQIWPFHFAIRRLHSSHSLLDALVFSKLSRNFAVVKTWQFPNFCTWIQKKPELENSKCQRKIGEFQEETTTTGWTRLIFNRLCAMTQRT